MNKTEPIAIVGIGCRLPGADGPDAFWRLLAEGVDAISEVPADRWNLDELYDADPAAPGRMNTRWGGFLSHVDRFDAAFFGISPREAVHIDPQQRLLMEVAWEALENAGIAVEKLAGQPVGVFVGVSSFEYGTLQLAHVEDIRDGYAVTGSALSIAANRLSYLFDFRGPSVVIDTACSSSLVAAYQACQSLRLGESRLALAGGVNLLVSPAVTVGFSKLQAMAPDGRCKAFDASADGFVRGEGAGIVVLKTLTNAVADGDRIYAVIRGGAVNQDGRTNGLTAPNGLSQEALLRQAFSNAGVTSADLQYVEAHGTGTALGDPIELNALGAVLAAGRSRDSRCGVGSAKTNFGHLEAAAGIVGLIKLALSLDRRQLPPSLHFETPNRHIRFDVLPLRVVTRLEPWPSEGGPARGGVSSFGFGGTNAHLVLEEAPRRTERDAPPADGPSLLALSARSEQALADLAGAYAGMLGAEHPLQYSLADVCAAAAHGRSHHDFRLAAVAADRAEMAGKLSAFIAGESPREVESGRRVASRRRKVVFVFPGQGSQWLGMGRELIAREPVFAEAIERCDAAFAEHVNWSLREEIAASPERSRLDEVDVVQPAIFAIQVALAALWRSWGITPNAVVGQSMGEVAAAHVAGALSLPDAARIICRRSQLARQTTGRGAMAVVDLSFARANEILVGYEERLAVAVSNSPTSTVLSGDPDALDEVLAGLERDGVFCRRVKVDYASHSPQMDVLRDPLLSTLQALTPRKTTVPLYSTVTNTVAPGTDLGPDYWVRNLREPVLFASAIAKLLQDGIDVFLEISPHPILLPAIQQCVAHAHREATVLGSLRRDENERRSLFATLASLYAIGKPVEWSRLYPSTEKAVPLPTYPWQRERFWLDDDTTNTGGKSHAAAKARNPLIGEHVRSASGSETHVWQRGLSDRAFPFLKDHRVQGEIVVPATAYLEMALEAAAEALGDTAAITLEGATFERALVLAEGDSRNVQVVVTRYVEGRFDWQVFSELPASTVDGAPTFSRHASGHIRVMQPPLEEAVGGEAKAALQSIRDRCTTERSAAEHYQHMKGLQLNYGSAFQGIDTVWSGDHEAIAQLKAVPHEARRYRAFPPLLDSALQVLGGAIADDIDSTLVPVAIDRFRLVAPITPSAGLWAHAVYRRNGARLSGDVRLLNDAGELIAVASGVDLAPLDGAALAEPQQFYSLSWQRRAPAEMVADTIDGAVVIFADAIGVGERLAALVAARGAAPVLVVPGAALCIPDNPIAANRCQIDPTSGVDYVELFEELKRRGIAVGSVVHLWSLDVAEDFGDAARGTESALLLVQALAQTPVDEPIRLWLASRGTQSVTERDQVSPFRAPLWGLARTVAQEHPELTCTAIDLSEDPNESEIGALADELWRRDNEQQVVLRTAQRFVARLTATDCVPADSDPQLLSPDGVGTAPFRVQMAETGQLSSIGLRRTARRRPRPGEVEIEVVAVGLNFRDVFIALGVLPSDGDVVLGYECAGRITAIGAGVTNCKPGDEVVALARASLGSFVRTPAALVVPKPARLDFEEAATVPIAFLTAHYAVNHLGQLRGGERILIHSATGGVGLACVRLAQLLGAEIYATAGTDEKRRLLESLGVHRVMDSRSLSFRDEVMEATGGAGVDVVVNSLAGEALARGLEILAPGGRFVELGMRDRLQGGQLPLRSLEDSRSFFLVDLAGLATKRPEYCGRLLRDTLDLFEAKRLEPLPKRVFSVGDVSDAFHHLARGRHIGKVVVRMDPDPIAVLPSTDPAARVRDDGTYVLTGGLGGLALAVARWLVGLGAKDLVLIGRSAPTDAARQAIEQMEQAGARIRVDRFDVADAAAVDAAFARWADELPPVRGIVHAAGVLDDAILLKQSPARFRSVMAPKGEGAWNLHKASLGLDLDFFVLFSSAASMLGSAGQANYAAANQFLDSLAQSRRARNLPAVSINWGPWSDVGLAARPDRGGRLEGDGIGSLTPAAGVEALGRVLLANLTQVAVVNIDWNRWRVAHPIVAQSTFFSNQGDATARPADKDTMRSLLAAAPGEQLQLVADRLRAHLASVVRLPVSKIDIDQPLGAMGIDSLMAVELKNRVERDIGVAIPLLQLVRGPSLSELAQSIVASLSGRTGSAAVATNATNRAAAAKPSILTLLAAKDGQASSGGPP